MKCPICEKDVELQKKQVGVDEQGAPIFHQYAICRDCKKQWDLDKQRARKAAAARNADAPSAGKMVPKHEAADHTVSEKQPREQKASKKPALEKAVPEQTPPDKKAQQVSASGKAAPERKLVQKPAAAEPSSEGKAKQKPTAAELSSEGKAKQKTAAAATSPERKGKQETTAAEPSPEKKMKKKPVSAEPSSEGKARKKPPAAGSSSEGNDNRKPVSAEPSPEKKANKKSVSAESSSEGKTSRAPASTEPASEKKVHKRPVSEDASSEKKASKNPSSPESAAERKASRKPDSEEAGAERKTRRRPASGKPSSDRAASGKPVSEDAPGRKPVSENSAVKTGRPASANRDGEASQAGRPKRTGVKRSGTASGEQRYGNIPPDKVRAKKEHAVRKGYEDMLSTDPNYKPPKKKKTVSEMDDMSSAKGKRPESVKQRPHTKAELEDNHDEDEEMEYEEAKARFRIPRILFGGISIVAAGFFTYGGFSTGLDNIAAGGTASAGTVFIVYGICMLVSGLISIILQNSNSIVAYVLPMLSYIGAAAFTFLNRKDNSMLLYCAAAGAVLGIIFLVLGIVSRNSSYDDSEDYNDPFDDDYE